MRASHIQSINRRHPRSSQNNEQPIKKQYTKYLCDSDSPEELANLQMATARPVVGMHKRNILSNSDTSFKWFSREFEQFSTQYEESERQQSKVVAQYFSGSANQAYDTMDGAWLKYSTLKPKLLEWYPGKKISVRHQADRAFSEAQFKPGESFSIFVLRLERIAEIAFSDSLRVRVRQLCE